MSDDNLLERAKALRETALPRRICSIPGQTGYGNPSLNKGWDFSAVDELVRVVVPELITEVERLRSQSVEQVFRKKNEEIAAKDARIKELEALNELNHKNMRSWLDTTTDKEFLDKLSSEIGFKDAYIKRLEAAFLEATKEIVYATHEGRDAPEGEDVYAEKEAREALERIKNGND